MKLNMGHFQYVLESLQKNKTKVVNIRKYMPAALYNAPATMDSCYVSQVNHDREKKAKSCKTGSGGSEITAMQKESPCDILQMKELEISGVERENMVIQQIRS